MHRTISRTTVSFALLVLSGVACAQSLTGPPLGNGRLSSVIPLDGGCVDQDSSPSNATEHWDVQQTRTYQLTLSKVGDCANGGNDAAIQVMIVSSNTPNMCLVATKHSMGTYKFQVTLPPNACNTYQVLYCTSGCNPNSGKRARRAGGGSYPSLLRAKTFDADCKKAFADTDCTLGCSGWTSDLGGGCGTSAPTLHVTMPIVNQDALISVKGAAAGASLYLAANAFPFPSPVVLGGPCVAHVDALTAVIAGPFTTSSIGDFYLSIVPPPALASLAFRMQAAVIAPGGPLPALHLTNGVETIFGTCAPFCTYTAAALAGTGAGGTLFDDNYVDVFGSGLEIGDYDASNGSTPPNGLRWTSDSIGRSALKTLLGSAGGPSGSLTGDATNPASPSGGGALAIQTAALALNVRFNAAGLVGGAQVVFGKLIYLKMVTSDSLSGLSIEEILAAANDALAGNGLPAGYSHDTLAAFIATLNESFANCAMSEPSSHRLYAPLLP